MIKVNLQVFMDAPYSLLFTDYIQSCTGSNNNIHISVPPQVLASEA